MLLDARQTVLGFNIGRELMVPIAVAAVTALLGAGGSIIRERVLKRSAQHRRSLVLKDALEYVAFLEQVTRAQAGAGYFSGGPTPEVVCQELAKAYQAVRASRLEPPPANHTVKLKRALLLYRPATVGVFLAQLVFFLSALFFLGIVIYSIGDNPDREIAGFEELMIDVAVCLVYVLPLVAIRAVVYRLERRKARKDAGQTANGAGSVSCAPSWPAPHLVPSGAVATCLSRSSSDQMASS